MDTSALSAYPRVTVMGLGLFGGGAGAARFFARLGARVTVTDAASAEKLAPSIAQLADCAIEYALGGHPEALFIDTDLVVASQAVRPEHRLLRLARDHGIPVVTETGLALSLNRAPWLAVTGSSGKSTTAALAAHMLGRHDPRTLLGGNIGGSLLAAITSHPVDAPLVVELSSFQLTHIDDDFDAGRAAPPHVAVVTNVTPNHLDWHADFDEYAAAKYNLLRYQSPRDWAVVTADDPLLARWAESAPATVSLCAPDDPGGDNAAFVDDGNLCLRLHGREVARMSLAAFRLPGRHNICNALQAAMAAYLLRNDAAAVAEGLASFAGLPHRLQYVASVGGKQCINDSKATTPEAAVLALASVPGAKTLIAGGYDKQSPFEDLAAAIQRDAVAVVLLGPAGVRLGEAVAAAAGNRPAGLPPLRVADGGDDFEAAVTTALTLTPEGGAVLLSPGCASYGMFVNYEERGNRFCAIARRLEGAC